MLLDLNTIHAMQDAGLAFIAQVPHPCGCQTLDFSAEQVVAFVADRDQAIADSLGVTKAQYREWIESFGTPRCGATTKQGTRCKNFVSGGVQLSLKTWLKLDGDYCAVHGGAPSRKVR